MHLRFQALESEDGEVGEGELGGRVWGRGALGMGAGLETEVPEPCLPCWAPPGLCPLGTGSKERSGAP